MNISKNKPFRLILAQFVCRYLPPILAQRVRAWIYPIQLAYKDNFQFTTHSISGAKLTSRTGDFHAYPFSVHGYYDWRNICIAMTLCDKSDSIVEIGANIGTETVTFSDIVGQEGKVYAFEPLPDNLIQLKQNTSQSKNVIIYPVAAGHFSGKSLFQKPIDAACSGLGYVTNGEKALNINTIEVNMIKIDDLVEEIKSLSLLAIDVEGYEPNVLRGAGKIIRKFSPYIILEASPKLLKRATFNLMELKKILDDFDYVPFEIRRLGLSNVSLNNIKHASNWLCLPKNKSKVASEVSRNLFKSGVFPVIRNLNPLARLS